jgi:hypothetical protein
LWRKVGDILFPTSPTLVKNQVGASQWAKSGQCDWGNRKINTIYTCSILWYNSVTNINIQRITKSYSVDDNLPGQSARSGRNHNLFLYPWKLLTVAPDIYHQLLIIWDPKYVICFLFIYLSFYYYYNFFWLFRGVRLPPSGAPPPFFFEISGSATAFTTFVLQK